MITRHDDGALAATPAALTLTSRAGDRTEPFYFGDPTSPLYGCLHSPPPGRELGAGVLLCYPQGHEYARSHRAFRSLAERLARGGFDALRFDFFGSGDSAGSSTEARLERWLQDVAAAAVELEQRARPRRLLALGRRLGASLAAVAAARRGGIDALVLWDPVVDGPSYVAELEQAHDAWVHSHHGWGGVVLADDTPSETPAGAARPELLGHEVAPELLADLAALDLRRLERAPARAALLVDSGAEVRSAALADHLRKLGTAVEVRHLPDPESWSMDDVLLKQLVPMQILQAAGDWLTGVSR